MRKKFNVLLLIVLTMCLVGVSCDLSGIGNIKPDEYYGESTFKEDKTTLTAPVMLSAPVLQSVAPQETPEEPIVTQTQEVVIIDYKVPDYFSTEENTYIYTVVYNANNGENISSVVREYKDLETVTVYNPSEINFTKTSDSASTGYAFAGWNTKADGTGISINAGYTYEIGTGITLYAQWQPWVQLWNGGPKFAVNDIDGSYTWGIKTYANEFGGETTTYCKKADATDGILNAEYDIAAIKWGSNWRMPTTDEFEALIANNTSITWDNNSCTIKGTNGNTIVLTINGKSAQNRDACVYWTSTSNNSIYAYRFTVSTTTLNGLFTTKTSTNASKMFAVRAVLAD